MSRLFCFGLGYSAAAVARRLAADGWTICGTSRTAAGAEQLTLAGFPAVVFDGLRNSPAATSALDGATHVLLSIPPDSGGDAALRLHGGDIAKSSTVRWIGYFSTIGVYGDAGGGWVDETTPPNPASERGHRRLASEAGWHALGESSGKAVAILRLPGIYGPGRSAIDDLRAGTARRIVKPGQVFNRIHVDDIAAAVDAALQNQAPAGIYNVTDDHPAAPQDVVAYAAELLGISPPPEIAFEAANLSPMGRSFFADSKRVSNRRMKTCLGVQLAYPSYREGLKAIAAQKSGT